MKRGLKVVEGTQAEASPDMTISLEASGDTKAHIRAPPLTTIQHHPRGESLEEGMTDW
jgi:hypothetical protein